MKQKTNCQFTRLPSPWVGAALILFLLIGSQVPCLAQQTVGSIAGTVLDSSGATVPDAEVKARNVATNFVVTVTLKIQRILLHLQSSRRNLRGEVHQDRF